MWFPIVLIVVVVALVALGMRDDRARRRTSGDELGDDRAAKLHDTHAMPF